MKWEEDSHRQATKKGDSTLLVSKRERLAIVVPESFLREKFIALIMSHSKSSYKTDYII